MSLSEAPRGSTVQIVKISNDLARLQAIRFGIAEGTRVECSGSIQGGPVIIRQGNQELAIGRRLAGCIEVSPIRKV